MRSTILVLTIFATLLGCAGQEPPKPPEVSELNNVKTYASDLEPKKNISITKETTLQGASTDFWQGSDITGLDWMLGIAIDEAGKIYVGDSSDELSVHVFGSDGNYITSVGGEGRGPGEFSSIMDMKIIDHKLYVYDSRQVKIAVFSTDDFELVEEIRHRPIEGGQEKKGLSGWFAAEKALFHDTALLVGLAEHPRDSRKESPNYNIGEKRIRKYFISNFEGELVSDMLFEQRAAKDLVATVNGREVVNFFPLPFMGSPLRKSYKDQYIFTAWSEDFLVKVYNAKGEYQHAFYHPFQAHKINKENILEMIPKGDERDRGLIKNADLPEYWPVIHSMIVDDQKRLWVSTHQPKKNMHQWWVMNWKGELLVQFEWPKHRSIEKIKNGFLYARVINKTTGDQNMIKCSFDIE